jgi:DNA-binding FadR family transcriptional regulator
MSDLITRIAHPPEVLLHAKAQHGRLVDLLQRGQGRQAVALIREHMPGTAHILAGLL